MIQRLTISTGLLIACCLLATPTHAQVTVNAEARSQHSHNINPGPFSPFFTFAGNENGDPIFYTAAAGLTGNLISANGSSTTVSGTIVVNGNATAQNQFNDGNQLPLGVRLSYDVSFTISTTDGVLVTANGNTGNGLGPGAPEFDAFDPGESITISPATVSNVSFTGAPFDLGVTISTPTLMGVGMDNFRSANFGEGTNGAILDNGTDSVGFGVSTGSLLSNVAMDNGFAAGNRFPTMMLDTPLTLTMDVDATGTFNLKGFELVALVQYDATFPDPNADFRIARTQHNHNANTANANPPESFYVTEASGDDGTFFEYVPANGLSGSIIAGAADTTTVSGTLTVNGNANAANNFMNGNQLPAGVSLTYDVSFTISSPDGLITTDGGNTGNGIGVGPAQFEQLDDGEQLVFSAATISNVVFAGTPDDTDVSFIPGTVENVALDNFRSNNFAEVSEGAVLTQGSDTIGFGTASGSLASNIAMNNGLAAATRYPAMIMDQPITLAAEAGASIFNLKGIQLAAIYTGEVVTSQVLLGDVNRDGVVDLLDVGPFVDLLTSGGFQLEADVNQDGIFDLLDVGPFVEILGG